MPKRYWQIFLSNQKEISSLFFNQIKLSLIKQKQSISNTFKQLQTNSILKFCKLGLQIDKIMSFQKNQSSDFDFSVISKKSQSQPHLNFSVEHLLQQHPYHQQIHPNHTQQDPKFIQHSTPGRQQAQYQYVEQKGSFLEDLQKLQNSISFQSELYNVYGQEKSTLIMENHNNPSNLIAKSNSHLKTTNEDSQSHLTDDYGYLVIDFAEKKKLNNSSLQICPKKNPKKLQYAQSIHQLKLSSDSSRLIQQSSTLNCRYYNKKKRKTIQKTCNLKDFCPNFIPKHSYSQKRETLVKSVKNKDDHSFDQIQIGKKTKQFKTKSQQKKQNSKKRFNYSQINKILKQSSKQSPRLQDILSKSRSHSKKIPQKFKSNALTFPSSSVRNSNKSQKKFIIKQKNVYSEYYGFQKVEKQKIKPKNSQFFNSQTQKYKKSPNNKKKLNKIFQKRISSKQKKNELFCSPPTSHEDLTKFKKKKLSKYFEKPSSRPFQLNEILS